MTDYSRPITVLVLCLIYFLLGYAVVRAGREKARRKHEAAFQQAVGEAAADNDVTADQFLITITLIVMLMWPAFLVYAGYRRGLKILRRSKP